MNSTSFKQAYDLAFSKEDLSDADMDILHGCGLKGFQPVVAPLRTVAHFIRYQCQQFNGGCDVDELNNLRVIFRKKVQMV